MNSQEVLSPSKFLSLVLRYKPETIGITLDAQGWARVANLLNKAKAGSSSLTMEKLREVVRENDKQRFGFNEDF